MILWWWHLRPGGRGFIASADADDLALTSAVGHAVPGGVFFLLSALRLRRAVQENGPNPAKAGGRETGVESLAPAGPRGRTQLG